ncbi:MAG: hypothetical protein MJY56_01560 [Bacteroidales bacterium]|nr:hypothetical protein [Bacteroidales bacterium]
MKVLKEIFVFAVLAGFAFPSLVGCMDPQYIDPKDIPVKPQEPENPKKPDEPEEPEDPADDRFYSYDLVGIDQFGRSFGTIDSYKKDRTVGIFYWPWIGQPYADGVYDATKLRAQYGNDFVFKENHPGVSPDGQAHFWGEPLWGYYNSEDEWVIRKQMMMLTLAGVDFIYFDHTNGIVYTEVVLKVAQVIQDMIDAGWNPPRMTHYTHSLSIQTVDWLYRDIYQAHKEFKDTWYMHDGKPLLIAYTDPADDKAEAISRGDTGYNPSAMPAAQRGFFSFFKPNWPFDPTYDDGFTWVEWKFPQPYHRTSQMMNVTVASHPACPMSFSITRPGWINWGRGWNPYTKQNISEDVDRGTFFQLEWDEAVKADPPIVSVGGWNEWIAYKQIYDGEYMLCDSASKEYSRDIEPMRGGYEDAFYLQLISNIRRYKGVTGTDVRRQAPKPIDLKGSVTQWNDVTYAQKHPDSKQIARSAYSISKTLRYSQAAPKNALNEVKVSYDADNVYFLIKSKLAWSDPKSTDSDWVNLYIGTGEPSEKGWNGYEYLVGSSFSGGQVSVETLSSSFSKSEVGKVSYAKIANNLQISIPRSMIGLSDADGFYFKVTAGVENPSDILNTYTTGSAMPMGRLSYQYYFEK